MLGKPHAGWTNINIAGEKTCASYLTDVAFDFAKAIINVFREGEFKTVTIDAESDGTYIYVIGRFDTYVIEEDTEDGVPKLYTSYIYIEDLAKDLANDLENYFSDWITWLPELDLCDMDEKEANECKEEISKREELLKNYIKELRKYSS